MQGRSPHRSARETPAFMPGRDSAAREACPFLSHPPPDCAAGGACPHDPRSAGPVGEGGGGPRGQAQGECGMQRGAIQDDVLQAAKNRDTVQTYGLAVTSWRRRWTIRQRRCADLACGALHAPSAAMCRDVEARRPSANRRAGLENYATRWSPPAGRCLPHALGGAAAHDATPQIA